MVRERETTYDQKPPTPVQKVEAKIGWVDTQ